MKRVLAVAAMMFAASGAMAAPPVSAFGRLPAISQAVISPNGQHVAILGSGADRSAVSIATIDQTALPSLSLGEVQGVDLNWVGDDYVLVTGSVWQKIDARQAYHFERTIAVTPQAKVASALLSNDEISKFMVRQPVLGATTSPLRAYVMGLSMSTSGIYVASLWTVDPATGRGVLVERGDYDGVMWSIDPTGAPRIKLEVDSQNHRFRVMAQVKDTAARRIVLEGDYDSRRSYLGYSGGEHALYHIVDDHLVRLRLADGSSERVRGPLSGAQISLKWDVGRDVPVAVMKGDEPAGADWLDPELGGVAVAMAKAFKGRSSVLQNWSADRTRFVVRVDSASAPSAWYLFDKARKELSPLGEEYPELQGQEVGTTRALSYKARDGLDIPAYLTMPPGAPAKGARLPLIVLPHGGPHARDFGKFGYISHFLSSRGYAVLQPQFRGSWGFGRAFEDAGRGEWGGKMQSDLIDGVTALAALGDIDPSRVCIVGASFGGYAAMAGATFHPDTYRCGASIAGISDLGMLINERQRIYGSDGPHLDELRLELGQWDSGKIAATSPARHGAALKVPLLLMHGDRDTVVSIEQSRAMAKAGAAKGVELVVLPKENHDLTDAGTRTLMLQTLETFLAKHLPVQ